MFVMLLAKKTFISVHFTYDFHLYSMSYSLVAMIFGKVTKFSKMQLAGRPTISIKIRNINL